MHDTTAKTGSSLAITEKRPHRTGGCVGIFFQLFDWNRRFAEKKLFSKKLLPPARPKQGSKKFGGDEMLPKLRLIADENSGGFPNVKKNGCRNVDPEQKPEMRAPGLVARLMGLESMPTVQRDKPKKASSPGVGSDRVDYHSGFEREDLNLERGGAKHELRPQKLQKTGLFERRPVSRFGAEALQFKSILSRSRKLHPKLASPVKSPRIRSGRNASRLIDAATKILEPGLQSKSRTRYALTYSNTMHQAPKDGVMLEGTTSLSPDILKDSSYYTSAPKLLKGQSSCRNCGNLLDRVESRPIAEAAQSSVVTPSISDYGYPSSQGLERIKQRPNLCSIEQESEKFFEKIQDHSTSPADQATDNVRPPAEPITDRKSHNREAHFQWLLTNQHGKPQKDVPSSSGSKQKIQRKNQILPSRDRVLARSKSSNLQSNRVSLAANAINETKDFVALNRNLSGRTRSRIPAKVDNCKFDRERIFGNRRDDSVSPVRKRRSMNVGKQGESPRFVGSIFGRQKNISCNAMTGKEMDCNADSMIRTYTESRLARLGERNRTVGRDNNDNGVVSFTFNSPMKHKTRITTEVEKRRDSYDITTLTSPTLDKNDGLTCFQKPFPLSGDALGALIEQKLKELTCQEEDELATGSTPPKRTTAMILQELISALTAERPFLPDDTNIISGPKSVSCYHDHMSSPNITFQAKLRTAGASTGYSNGSDHLSPGSVLEASFSNDSCLSSSLDDSLGHKLNADSMDCCYDELQALEPYADLLDSATSLRKGRTARELVTDLLDHIYEVLYNINLADTWLKGSKLVHAKEVILNFELVFGHNLDGTKDFSISRFLLDKLETLASVMWMNFSCFLGFDDNKKGNQLKGFLFDCVIEYLESRYGRYSKSGFKAWANLPLRMNAEMLTSEVVEDVRRWTDLVGLIPDDLIEREMSHSLGKWTDFEIEEFETGVEIDGDILQILVDEIVADLSECSWVRL